MLVLLRQRAPLPLQIAAVALQVLHHQVLAGQLVVIREMVDYLGNGKARLNYCIKTVGESLIILGSRSFCIPSRRRRGSGRSASRPSRSASRRLKNDIRFET